jgi:hypothetical protein
VEDAPRLCELYLAVCRRYDEEPLLADRERLVRSLSSQSIRWIVAHDGDGLAGAVSMFVDREHRLGKMHRLLTRPGAGLETSRGLIECLLDHAGREDELALVYTTTRSLSREEQDLTLDLGFVALGVFPNAWGADCTRLNGLTARYLGDSLGRDRHSSFELHPAVRGLFEIVRRGLGLAPLAEVSVAPPRPAGEPLGALETIEAPEFVAHRFRRLLERRSLAVTFYPFAEPNALVTDPEQSIEVFVRLAAPVRFAAVLAERLERPVDPIALYGRVARILYDHGASYVETIVDAADATGIECITKAGYVPCAYFPSLKSHGGSRRDFVVFSRTFELPWFAEAAVRPIFLELFREYDRQLRRASLPREWGL